MKTNNNKITKWDQAGVSVPSLRAELSSLIAHTHSIRCSLSRVFEVYQTTASPHRFPSCHSVQSAAVSLLRVSCGFSCMHPYPTATQCPSKKQTSLSKVWLRSSVSSTWKFSTGFPWPSGPFVVEPWLYSNSPLLLFSLGHQICFLSHSRPANLPPYSGPLHLLLHSECLLSLFPQLPLHDQSRFCSNVTSHRHLPLRYLPNSSFLPSSSQKHICLSLSLSWYLHLTLFYW